VVVVYGWFARLFEVMIADLQLAVVQGTDLVVDLHPERTRRKEGSMQAF
jgi:hypothetical protein